jgi:iron complex outermembrane recepter protein
MGDRASCLSHIPTAVRRALLAATALTVVGNTLPAFAQDAGDEEITAVVITGTRIARQETEASTPVQVLSSEYLQQQGSQNIVDILQELPAFGTAGISRANSNFAVNGNGVSTLNLRNAGDSRTLVLINGRRTAAGVGGDSAVDVNNIPTALVKSVEVITGGASAVYGSEAIAGVVNFVLDDNFEGLEFRGQTGQTSEFDNDRHLFSVTAGMNFLDRGNVTFNAQYDKDNGLRSRNRAISANDIPFRSSFVPQGRFETSNNVWTYGPDNVLKNSYNGAVDGFNRNGERYISVPLERTLLNALAHFDLTDRVTAFAEAGYSQVDSNSRLEALATDNSDARLPNGDEYAGLTLDNPFIPAAIRADMIAGGDTTLSFRKRMNGVFDRSNVASRDFYRVVAGLRGDLFETWKWDAYYSQSQTKEDTKSETGLRDRYFFALDAIAGPGGTVICRDAAARAAGCVPFNPFGFNSVSRESAAYLRNNQFDTYAAKVEQNYFGANLSGTVMTLPAGPLQVAIGAERREEESSEVYSLQTQLGNTLGNALTNTVGKYDVSEAYIEAVVPVLSDLPLVRKLDVEAAYRAGDYSTVGSVDNWKVGLNWTPMDGLTLHGVYANATRAPNIAELFDGQSQTFPSGLTDPCEGVTATGANGLPAAVATYCRNLPGFAQNLARYGGRFTYDNNRDRQSIEGFDGGNPLLGPETAKTWTVGFDFTPAALPGFAMTVDWFDIRVSDAIQLVPRQFIIDQCVLSAGTSELCSFITREPAAPVRPRSPGVLFQVDSGPVNAASIVTQGVDIGLRYGHTLGNGHRLSSALNYTYLSKLSLQPLATEPAQQNLGQLNGDGRLGAGFKHRAQLSNTYQAGNFTGTWRMNFQSKIKDTLDPASQLLSDDENSVPAYIYHDLQFRYGFGADKKVETYLGIDNVFDKKPPLINQNGASNITGTETAAESFDPIGRFIYVGVQYRMF